MNLSVIFPYLLAALMFGMGMTLTTDDFKRVVIFPKATLIGVINQIIFVPILGLFVVKLLDLSPEIAIGLMVIAACPGGATSNLITYLSKGDVALSITLTAISSVVTVFTIPFIINLSLSYFGTGTATDIQLPIIPTIRTIILITALPTALGMFVNAQFPNFTKKAESVLNFASVSMIILALVLVFLILQERGSVWGFVTQAGLPVILLNFITLLIGFLSAKLAKLGTPQAITISVETGIQNGTLGITIATTLMKAPEMAVPSAVYAFVMCFSGFLAVFLFRRLK
jgi:BASS family bile acid:Na+ symporter